MSKGLRAALADTRVRTAVRTPSYRKHSTRDFGFVEMDGKRHRLPGAHNSAESLGAYHELIAKIQRRTIVPAAAMLADDTIVVAALCARYLVHCEQAYGRKARGEYRNNADAVLHLIRAYPAVRVRDFSPKVFREFQATLATTKKQKRTKAGLVPTADNLSRRYVNSLMERIRRMFSWAVAEELMSGAQFHALQQVKGLRRGRSSARETAKRKAVPLRYVKAVLPHVTPTVRAMLRVQVYTGARGDSICAARPEEFDTSGKVWLWRPKHKTEYLERELVLPIGPRCQRVLTPFLKATKPGQYLFSPQAVRKSRRYGLRYKPLSYRLAVVRGIETANKSLPADKQIPHWTPHQIRHYKGDAVNAKYGLEAAAAILGHDDLTATKIYRSKRLSLAKKVAKETG